MASLPDASFLDVVPRFLRCCDEVLFNHNAIDVAKAVEMRSAHAERLILTRAWRSLARSETSSTEVRLGPAAAVFFFNDYSIGQMPRCYLFPHAIEKVDDLIPLFQRLIVSAPSFFIAIVTLNLLKVAHRSEHLPLTISALTAWLDGYPDNGAFWVDHNIGRRACAWIEAVRKAYPAQFAAGTPIRAVIDRLLAAMVSLGVPEATRLERALAAER
jgi:hypothetical protein